MFAFNADGDGAGLFVGGELYFVTALQVDACGLGERVVFGVFGGAGVTDDAGVGGLGGRFGQFGDVGDAERLPVEFKAFGVAGEAGDADAVLAGRDEDDVAVGELDQRHLPEQDEVVEVEAGAGLVAAFDLDVEERAAFEVDAASLVEVVQQAVHAGAVEQPGAVDEAGDEHAHGLGGGEAGVALDVAAEHAAGGGFDEPLQVLVVRAEDVYGADVGQEDVAFGVDGDGGVEFERTPETHLDLVADGDGVVGVELGGAVTGESASEQVGAEHVAALVGGVITCLWGLDVGGGGRGCHLGGGGRQAGGAAKVAAGTGLLATDVAGQLAEQLGDACGVGAGSVAGGWQQQGNSQQGGAVR